MIRFKGTLRIYTGEGADKHSKWCDYEENEWIRAGEVDAEIARLRKALETLEGSIMNRIYPNIMTEEMTMRKAREDWILGVIDDALAPEKDEDDTPPGCDGVELLFEGPLPGSLK